MTSASHTCGCTHSPPRPPPSSLRRPRGQALRWHLQQTAQAAIDGKAPKTDKILPPQGPGSVGEDVEGGDDAAARIP